VTFVLTPPPPDKPRRLVPDGNPMVVKHGAGPEGATCRHCQHICRFRPGVNTYIKCRMRGITAGPGTDHRLKWKACRFYQKEGTE
jgi:hypothetical protein